MDSTRTNAGTDLSCCSQQVGGANVAQGIGRVHITVMQRAALWKGRQHMHNGIGLPSLYGSEQAVAVHHVSDNGLRPQRGEPAGFFGGSTEAEDLVTACGEGADQWDTKSTGRAGDEHLHACPSMMSIFMSVPTA
jgi:hypothetical protein